MIDSDKIKKLIELADPQDQVKLQVLKNATLTRLRDYQTDSTAARLNDWQKAEGALDAFARELWARHFETERSLPNILAVVEYLNLQGWKIAKSAGYKHQKAGMLRTSPDGTFKISDVERYAGAYLKRKDGSGSEKQDDLQQDRQLAEIRKMKADADISEIKRNNMAGAYIPKERFEYELSRRAAVLKNDLQTFAASEASEIVGRVAGDASRIPDLIEYLLGRVEDFLARYAEEERTRIPAPAAAMKGEKMETDDQEDDEE